MTLSLLLVASYALKRLERRQHWHKFTMGSAGETRTAPSAGASTHVVALAAARDQTIWCVAHFFDDEIAGREDDELCMRQSTHTK